MAEPIIIQLSEVYEPITQADIRREKNYVLQRERVAAGVSALVDTLMQDAAQRITEIAYRYGVDPKTFTISQRYNEKMFEEIAEALNQLEEDILELVESYALRCTDDNKRKNLLLLWLLALGKGRRTLRSTLERRLKMFMRDMEVMIAALKSANISLTKAIGRIRNSLHAVYIMPEVKKVIKNGRDYRATYIRTGGVKHGNVGNSNSEANNIIRFATVTVQMAWMHEHYYEYKESGAAGYYVLRGSNYPCQICDDMVGFHVIDDEEGYPPYHAHCCCYTLPIFEKTVETPPLDIL